jgi:hypothetical protein
MVTGLVLITGCGSPTNSNTSALSSDPACGLVSVAQASAILGRPAAAAANKPTATHVSSCGWHGTPPVGDESFEVFVTHNAGAVGAFRASLAQPQSPVVRTTVDGAGALWRPFVGSGVGTSFMSSVASQSLVSVEAVGSASAANDIVKNVMQDALHALRSLPASGA